MKRIFSESPVTGYQLFRYASTRSDGTLSVHPMFYIRHNGHETRTKTDKLKVAQAHAKKAAGEDAQGAKRRARPDVPVGVLLDLVLEDHKANARKAIVDTKCKIENALRPYFGEKVAATIDSDEIDRWIEWRRGQHFRSKKPHPIQPATINRELEILRRGFRLGYERKPQLVDRMPPLKMLRVDNVRKGFVTPEQYKKLITELPAHLQPITKIAFHVGNRKGELLKLEWSDVDLDGDPPVLTLWPGETKNGRGRTLPILSGEMMDALRALKAIHDHGRPKKSHVFLGADGKPLTDSAMRKPWKEACKRAGLPGLLFHDLRRSAVRNLRRAGVTESVAMQFSGHRTNATFKRYDIVDFDDLRDAAARLGKYLGAQSDQTKTQDSK